MSDETYECAGCAGEVSVVGARWLPENLHRLNQSRPYCCLACFESHKPQEQPLEFIECDSCRSKPGSPTLCGGCLFNRKMAGKLGVPFNSWPTELGYSE